MNNPKQEAKPLSAAEEKKLRDTFNACAAELAPALTAHQNELLGTAINFDENTRKPVSIIITLDEDMKSDTSDIPAIVGADKLPVVIAYQNKFDKQAEDRIEEIDRFMEQAEKIGKAAEEKYKTEIAAFAKKFPEGKCGISIPMSTMKPIINITLPEGSTADISGIPATIGKDNVPVRVTYENKKQNELHAFFEKHADKLTDILASLHGATFGPRWDKETGTPYFEIQLPEGSTQDTSHVPATVGEEKIPIRVEKWRPSACPAPTKKKNPGPQ